MLVGSNAVKGLRIGKVSVLSLWPYGCGHVPRDTQSPVLCSEVSKQQHPESQVSARGWGSRT